MSAPVQHLESHEREVVLVGTGIAAASGLVLLGSMFVAWYRYPGFCFAVCPARHASGWSALGAASAVVVVAALAALLPLLSLRASRLRGVLCAAGGVAALGAAMLVVFRIAVAPGAIAGESVTRMPGPFIALLAGLGACGGAMLAGLGPRFFDPPRHEATALITVLGASIVIVTSLFMPWIRRGTVPRAPNTVTINSGTPTAWDAAPTVAVLLLLGALAIMCAVGLVAVIRWRCAFVALAAGGWLAAAIAAAATPLAAGSGTPAVPGSRLSAYGFGYYVCLGAAGVIAITGLCTGADGAAGGRPAAPRHLPAVPLSESLA